MKRKYNYFYKITNNINNHFYYGVHCTDNLDDGYMGSGTRLHYAYKKYGVENFSKEILKFFDSITEAYEYESEIVTEDLVHDPNCYNIQCGGKGWNTYGTIIVKDTDGNCFRCDKNDPKYLNGEYISVSKGQVTVKDKLGNYFNISKNDPRYLSGEYIAASTNKICIKSKITGEFNFVDENDNRLNSDEYERSSTFGKNKIVVKDNKGKCYYIDKNDPRYISGQLHGTFFNKNHKKETVEKIKQTFKNIKHQQGEKNSQYGTCWVYKLDKNNKPISIKIKKEELENYLNNDWNKGRKIENTDNISKANKNKMWVHKENISKMIYKKDLNYFLEQGFEYGRGIIYNKI